MDSSTNGNGNGNSKTLGTILLVAFLILFIAIIILQA